jgi:glycosyltransferase involved in cell wall biosynthesis
MNMTPITRSGSPDRIFLLIRSLHIGGAERQVVSLAKTLAKFGVEVHVGVKVSGGALEGDLSDVHGITLHHLGRDGLLGRFQYLLALRSLIKQNLFQAVYGFLPSPNLALLVARTLRSRPLIAWGVRSSDVEPGHYTGRVKWTMRLEKWLSMFSDRVITNSQAALEEYRRKGYRYSKLEHIPNAIDVERFKPDPEARRIIADELGLRENTTLIGHLARIHPMKDHMTLLRAAAILIEDSPNVIFACAGEVSTGYSEYGARIRVTATELGLDDHLIWVGPRNDPERLMAACDLTTLTSDSGEGFPNSVAESLACGTSCVVTDVGDASLIAGKHGATVPRRDPEALARAWKSVMDRSEEIVERDKVSARYSIIERYSSDEIAGRTLVSLSVSGG